jgi:GT2 family glycosyltransferase
MTGATSANAAVQGPRVYVILLNWNGAGDTIECLSALRRLHHTNWVTVLCDNASRREDVQALQHWGSQQPAGMIELEQAALSAGTAQPLQLSVGQVVLVHTGANLGFAGGVNVGLRFAMAQADAEYFWILNNDTEVASDALTALLARMQADPAIGICGSSLVYHGKRDEVQALGGASYSAWRARSRALGAFSATRDMPVDAAETEARMAYVVGAAMLVSRRLIETIGLMDERYFLYSEEHDWAHRARARGFRLAWAPRSLVFHKHGATIGTKASGGSPLSLFYLYRSKAMFARKFHTAWLPLVLPALALEGIKFLLKRQPDKSLAVFAGLWAFCCGKTGQRSA